MIHDNGAPRCHAGGLSVSVWVDGWFNLLHTDYSMCNNGGQPLRGPRVNSDSGQGRLLKPHNLCVFIHTHTHTPTV